MKAIIEFMQGSTEKKYLIANNENFLMLKNINNERCELK